MAGDPNTPRPFGLLELYYLFVVFLYALGFTLSRSVLSFHVRSLTQLPNALSTVDRLGPTSSVTSATLFATVMSSYTVSKMMVAPVAGLLSDKHGRVAILVPALLCAGACNLGVGASQTWYWALLARTAMGMVGVSGMLLQAMILDLAPKAKHARLFGHWELGWSLATVCGGYVAIRVLEKDVWACHLWSFVCFACTAGLVCVGHATVLAPRAGVQGVAEAPACRRKGGKAAAPAQKGQQACSRCSELDVCQSFRLAVLGHSALQALFWIDLLTPRFEFTMLLQEKHSVGPEAHAQLSSIGSMCGLLVPLFDLPSRSERLLGNRRTTAFAALLAVAPVLMLSRVGSMRGLACCVFLKSMCYGVMMPARKAFLAEGIDHERAGAAMGWLYTLKGFSQVSSTFLSSWLSVLHYSVPFDAIGLSLLLTGAALTRVRGKGKVD